MPADKPTIKTTIANGRSALGAGAHAPQTFRNPVPDFANEPERYELAEPLPYQFRMDRRVFLQSIAGGFLLFAACSRDASGQRRQVSDSVDARLRFGADGSITVLNGKVEEGQGSRTEVAMAAAEELRVPLQAVTVQMADTAISPNDWITAGSSTTPSTVPAVRNAAAAARELLLQFAATKWQTDRQKLRVDEGKVRSADGSKSLSYKDLAADEAFLRSEANSMEAAITAPAEWQTLGKASGRINGRDIVTGRHQFPSDIQLPGMMHGVILRPPSYGAILQKLGESSSLPNGATLVQDREFVGVVAQTAFAARQATEALAAKTTWKQDKAPRQEDLWRSFREGGKPQAGGERERVSANLSNAKTTLEASFEVPYIHHAPMEPRAAVAEWKDGKLTVWTGTSGPFNVQNDLAKTFGLAPEQVRVIVPDFGGGFGGKHTGEAAIEAARLAKEVKRPVSLRWTRQEEFSWAYCRPAALIDIRAGIDEKGAITAWEFLNYNAGGSGLKSPYRAAALHEEFIRAETPLRQGSYRALASTANNFARETLMDELAKAAGQDPLAFRLAHMHDQRLRVVLEAVAERFGWEKRKRELRPGRGIGIACGNEKNSVVATCVEVELDAATGVPRVLELCQTYECGAILNPKGLQQQAEGGIIMGLGAVLHEGIRYADGMVTNRYFRQYRVPRMRDLPKMDLVFLDRKDAPSNGAGETPIIGIAPAVANAVFALSGQPVRQMPIRGPRTKAA